MAIYRAVLTGIYLNQLCQNVFHFRHYTDGVDASLGLANSINNNYVEQIRFFQNIGFQYSTITVQKKLPSALTPLVVDIGNKTGTLSGAGYHPSIAILFTLRSSDPSRKGRGRVYMPGVHGQTPLNGLVHPTVLNNLTTVAGIWMGVWGPSGSSEFKWCVGPGTYPSDDTYLEVVAIIPRPYFGIQRRRNIGVGG